MKDDFEATFVVEIAPDEVWQALTERTIAGDDDGEKLYVLPGFPSFPPSAIEGAPCTLVEQEVGHLLKVKKASHPCLGTEIAITLEQAATGTRVTVVQSGFGPFLDFAGRDTVFGHGAQIVTDLRLFLERGITVPGTIWRHNLGARLLQTAVGLELATVEPDGFAERAGMLAGDLLLTLDGIRLHDLQQFWSVMALLETGSEIDVSWARGREAMVGTAAFAD
jgi:uncharacterized protein YndB with AHSA1/START domain